MQYFLNIACMDLNPTSTPIYSLTFFRFFSLSSLPFSYLTHPTLPSNTPSDSSEMRPRTKSQWTHKTPSSMPSVSSVEDSPTHLFKVTWSSSPSKSFTVPRTSPWSWSPTRAKRILRWRNIVHGSYKDEKNRWGLSGSNYKETWWLLFRLISMTHRGKLQRMLRCEWDQPLAPISASLMSSLLFRLGCHQWVFKFVFGK